MSESTSRCTAAPLRTPALADSLKPRSITRELPHNVPFPSKVSVIEKFIAGWKEIALDTLETIRPIVETIMLDLAHKHFGRYTEGMLPATIR